jgi:hypothetical protein
VLPVTGWIFVLHNRSLSWKEIRMAYYDDSEIMLPLIPLPWFPHNAGLDFSINNVSFTALFDTGAAAVTIDQSTAKYVNICFVA